MRKKRTRGCLLTQEAKILLALFFIAFCWTIAVAQFVLAVMT